MSPNEVRVAVSRIVEGHRRGRYDVQESVNLLELCFRQSPTMQSQEEVIQALWATLHEPLRPPKPVRSFVLNLHAVAIRAIAAFGPTAELPPRAFSLLQWDNDELAEIWAQTVASELSYCIWHYADRFSQATLDQTKAFCATYTYHEGLSPFVRADFPKSVIDGVCAIEDTIEALEYKRFAKALREAAPPEIAGKEPEDALRSLKPPAEVSAALEKARSHLDSAGPFDAKTAADLIRSCIDATHEMVVTELESVTNTPCTDRSKDGSRRAYLRAVDFISAPEEIFFSSIYTLLSQEASHKLIAPRETILLLYDTVHAYLVLLLRRLHARRASLPP